MWFATQPTDLSWIERAPHRIEHEILVFAPPERVFDVLAGEGFHEWLEQLRACRWTSPEPHGVGSTREVELDVLAVKERFLAWERGVRLAFAIDAITVPLVRRMVEEMRLLRRGDDRTLLRYVVHYEPSLAMRAIHPAGRVVFGKMFRDATRRVAMVAARGSTRRASGIEVAVGV